MKFHRGALFSVLLVIPSLLGLVAFAQPSAVNRNISRTAIKMSTIVPRPLSDERKQVLEESVVATPATELPSGAAIVNPPQATPPEQIPLLEKGKLYHVDVSAANEQTIANALIGQTAIRSQGDVIVPLPGVFRQQAVDGSELLLKPFVIPQRLSFDESTGRFLGSIKIGVSEIGGFAAPRDLSAPISFQVLEDGVAKPEELIVRRSGFPLSRIEIATRDAADGLTVTVASPFNPEGVPVMLELGPSLRMDINDSIEGLGLEATGVNVSVTGVRNPAGKLVRLTVSGPAKLETQSLRLDEHGDASTELRSVGVGRAIVKARVAGFQTLASSVGLNIPFLTIGASILGGVVGGLIRLLPGVSNRRSGRRFWARLVVAVLVGIFVFALYAVGVNVLPFAPKVQVGAVLIFAVSAAGAFFGSRLLGDGSAPPQ